MPALLINNKLYCNTPISSPQEISYSFFDMETYGWKVYYPSMVLIGSEAHLSFRLQTLNKNAYSASSWTPVLKLSVKPKARVYGVVNTSYPRTERFSAYIDTDGILYIIPNVDVNSTIIADIIFVFETAEAYESGQIGSGELSLS